jgi:hypothetical protein
LSGSVAADVKSGEATAWYDGYRVLDKNMLNALTDSSDSKLHILCLDTNPL